MCKLACSEMFQSQEEPLNLRIREILQRTGELGEAGVRQVAVVGFSESGMFRVGHGESKALFKLAPIS